MVDYRGLKADLSLVREYTHLLTTHPPDKSWSTKEQLAYWINAYNAFTVLLIIEHYPLQSIKDIAGSIPMINSVWDMKFFKIGNTSFDLNTIEHKILRKLYDEPRIHFSINCASISCPNLRNEAFSAERLEEQLEEQAYNFLGDTTKNHITTKEIHLSKIFEWFESDFTKQGTIKEYLGQYLSDSTVIDKTPISYMDYNWNLNENKNA